jgi:hypothetical protein
MTSAVIMCVILVSVIMLNIVNGKCHYAECRYAECFGAHLLLKILQKLSWFFHSRFRTVLTTLYFLPNFQVGKLECLSVASLFSLLLYNALAYGTICDLWSKLRIVNVSPFKEALVEY